MNLSRRSFCAAAVALPFALPRVSMQRTPPVGLELYSVRDNLMLDMVGTLRAVAAMGYEVVEFYAPYFTWSTTVARTVRQVLDDHGLVCRSTHNGAASFSAAGLEHAIELNQIIGSNTIVLAGAPVITAVEGWRSLADELTRAADVLRPLGMAAGYHNHQTEWRMVDGQRPMDVLARNTPADVVLQLDVGTCIEAGADPVAWIRANPGRIRSIHCKDWNAAQGYAVVFGEGDAPWLELFRAAESVGGVECYLIEQEIAPVGQELDMVRRCLLNYRALRGM